MPNAHIVRADLCRLPFRPSQFSFVYSYGVVHHVPDPAQAMSELARVSEPGAGAAIYVYEDFSHRSALLRWSLRAVNVSRALTTRLPHVALYALCAVAAPVVFAAFTVPHLVLRQVPLTRGVAAAIPFRHGTGPFSLIGDLYDRFSAPVEFRYSRDGAAALANSGDSSAKLLAAQSRKRCGLILVPSNSWVRRDRQW